MPLSDKSRRASKHPPVAVIVLVWNNITDTLSCLTSISEMDYDNLEIIVVDNGSDKGVADAIRRGFPEVKIQEMGVNLGFSAGNNAGIRYAMEHGFEYVFLLNNDTRVSPNLLGKLVSFAQLHSNIGMLGPAVRCMGEKDILYALGGYIRWSEGKTYNRGMFEPLERFSTFVGPVPVDFVPGCGVLVRRRFIEAVGFLDPEYFFNFEEVEWAVRGRSLGFEAWCLPEAVMWHKASASLGRTSPANTYYMTRNALRFFWDNAPGYLRWLSVSRIIFRTLRTIAAWSLKPKFRQNCFRRSAIANMFALRDFFLNRYGKLGPEVAQVCDVVQ